MDLYTTPRDPFAVFEDPIREEVFSQERLGEHAKSLADIQKITDTPRSGKSLTPRIRENGRLLRTAHNAVSESAGMNRAITPAAEWLLDNFHIVDEQLRDIQDHLPDGYYRDLPKLAGGPFRQYPRVFEIAWAFVAHNDSRFEPKTLIQFIHAYQAVQPLTIGELWAVPITLRIVLIENLRRIAVRIIGSARASREANRIIDDLLGADGGSLEKTIATLRKREDKPFSNTFAVQLIQRLRNHRADVAAIMQWLADRLMAQGMTPDEAVIFEHGLQASDNITVRNIITSMRLISAYSWNEFFEEVSLVDEVLRSDPLFLQMDFTTRDRYRHGLEELAKGARRQELDVARLVIDKAEKARATAGESDERIDWRQMDPGYYLISKGRAEFETEIGFRPSLRQRFLRIYMSCITPAYLVSIGLVTLIVMAIPMWISFGAGVPLPWLLLFGLLALFPASDIAVTLVNWFMGGQIGSRHLPRLELADGVPSSLRTFVVVPSLLTSEIEAQKQSELLERHYLANPSGDVRFALLTDWPDADAEVLPGDRELLNFAAELIEQLNDIHGDVSEGGKRFFLLHRKRLWNESEGLWMGWERKRGKLHEFNRLLRGATDTSFISNDASSSQVPTDVRYVITLDRDTKLPVNTVNELVGSMAHPLNLPRFDEPLGRVVEGYGVLQPRITPSFPSDGDRTLYHRIFSGPLGIDPYSSATSDIYQDLFEEGSFTGKGIYDVDAFEVALAGRVPENTILSHDLFEGAFARCGLASDIVLFEEFPSNSEVAASRLHRWVRGDWQLLPWIVGIRRKGLSIIGRWKMIDNLRRSLSAPAMFFLFLLSWFCLSAPHGVWALFILASIAFPALLSFIIGLTPKNRDISKRNHLRAVLEDLLLGAGHAAIVLTLLAHSAWLMLDAICRTLVRLYVSRRKLLQWVTAAQEKADADLSVRFFFQRMLAAEILALTSFFLIAIFASSALFVAAPFIFLWVISPCVAKKISTPPLTSLTETLPDEDVVFLRLIAREIWRFFTTFVTADDHWLPPDNFQEEPHPVLAHRSSPTNFGVYLLSIIAARDFGWIGLSNTADKLTATIESMEALPRYRGHFYNWYETREARTLEPRYISSVDSGNLAGHLLALSQACKELTRSPIPFPAASRGVVDTLRLLRRAMEQSGNESSGQLSDIIAELETCLADVPPGLAGQVQFWETLETGAKAVVKAIQISSQESGEGKKSDVATWAELLLNDIASHRDDIDLLLPWLRVSLERLPESQGAGEEEGIRRIYLDMLESGIPLTELPERCEAAVEKLLQMETRRLSKESRIHLDALIAAFERSAATCRMLTERFERISGQARRLFDEMDFTFLFDTSCRLFSTGYRVSDEQLDETFYDLLASEARLTSFIAIAKGEVPASHWFRLGRALIPVEKSAALVSWSGSMFEYLMPSLVFDTPRGSLLDQTCRTVITRQISYGRKNGVPWGISESAYNLRDLSFAYQYSAFGIPDLGLKRGLGQDLVIAPYATMLAAMYAPASAAQNCRRLEKVGGRGPFGFYEALDFTPARLPEGTRAAVVKAYMAHHKGMSLIALGNVIYDGVFRRRFHDEPMIQAAELLLEERMPRNVSVARPLPDQVRSAKVREGVQPVLRRFHSPNHRIPSTHLLSNSRYAVMVTAAGSGYSRWRDIAVTRWREDAACDAWGSYIFLRDSNSGTVWSASYQPTGLEPKRYEVSFNEDQARIVRHDAALQTILEIILSPQDDVELRRLSITNQGSVARDIEVTSYAEIVLAPPNADIAHPAFSNLFVETEYDAASSALLAHRRPRSADTPAVWAAHTIALEDGSYNRIEYETDRMRFLGRGQTIRRPVSIMDGKPLSNTVGNVLDPIFSLRTRVQVAPGKTVHLTFSTMVAGSREKALQLAGKYRSPASYERTQTLAWTQSQIQLHYLGIQRGEAHLFQHLANRLLYADAAMRPSDEALRQNDLNVTALWQYGISGDYPIILVRIDNDDDQSIIRQLLRAHEYLRLKLLAVDLVILNEKKTSYVQELQHSLESIVNSSVSSGHAWQESRGNIFILRADLLSHRERMFLQTAARVVLAAGNGSLTEQIRRMRRQELRTVQPVRRQFPRHSSAKGSLTKPELEFFNGLGGFAQEGREYVITLGPEQYTPAPWINVIANEHFGFQVSESGAGYTWSLNSRENQITPWSNDPVSDSSGEAFYLCDLENGAVWSPTALPIRVEGADYIARHGQGYSRFEHLSHDICSELLQFVCLNDPVKISLLVLENRSTKQRTLSVTAYIEWVLGFTRTVSAPYIVTEMDDRTGAMFAQNSWHAEFGDRIAFADFGGDQTAWTADRIEFLGRNGTLEQPAGLSKEKVLNGRTGAGLDPCCVLQTTLDLEPGEKIELLFLLGQAEDREMARELIERLRSAAPRDELTAVHENWERLLGKIQVQTPDRGMDIMLNRWLLYQTLACRFWARAAFYQAGGAYGFRDQLQDCLALVLTAPDLVRTHILRASGRQFKEGDVQHWWHPPTGRGVRTHFSDDLIWLPYTLAHYLEVTGDAKILDEKTPFLEGEKLAPDQEDAYFEPIVSVESATVFEHCARALDARLTTGAHGLPLMGTGDWNDGMNRVGHEGRGESAWLAWFLYAAFTRFAPVATARGEDERAQRWLAQAANLKEAMEKHGWDGAWYRRAYYDDGTPLGSAASRECRIDSIAQSWGVISGAADPVRIEKAMTFVEEYLVKQADNLVLLFTPPFNHTLKDPGYIKGYPPGIRENGGQYTHAAVWSVIAFAMLGHGDKAHGLFSMLNPVNLAATPGGMHRYRIEPYVVAADVYSEPPHMGRGGWSWYTGSSGWLYRAGLEWLLGITVRADALLIEPCIPKTWPGFTATYRHDKASYEIEVENPHAHERGVAWVEMDGERMADKTIPLGQGSGKHRVVVRMGNPE